MSSKSLGFGFFGVFFLASIGSFHIVGPHTGNQLRVQRKSMVLVTLTRPAILCALDQHGTAALQVAVQLPFLNCCQQSAHSMPPAEGARTSWTRYPQGCEKQGALRQYRGLNLPDLMWLDFHRGCFVEGSKETK